MTLHFHPIHEPVENLDDLAPRNMLATLLCAALLMSALLGLWATIEAWVG